MPPSDQELYEKVCTHARETAMLASIDGLLSWDERTKMPGAAGAYRAEQMTYLAGQIHRRQTAPELGQWLDALAESPLAADPHSDSGAVIRQLRRSYKKKTRLPQRLVEELARTASLGEQAWVEARRRSDFGAFRPLLERTIVLKREEADAVGYPTCRYDALLDDFEPHALTAEVAKALNGVRDELVALVQRVSDSGRHANTSILERRYPIDVQEMLGIAAARAIGFDFDRGRLDVTHHPFCGQAGPHDVRLTTRYDERFFNASFFSILHEAGHGLYDQGLPADAFGLPTGEAVSLGIHESQSRMWENLVGRSLAFWQFFYGQTQQAFPEALGEVPLADFHFAVNDVRPSLIRVEADEATYNLHILVRFELEQALLNDELGVADLPGAWNEKYRDYLGVTVPNDAEGVLQDVHWSAGLFGYFPTYALGNLFAAQFFEQADRDLGGLEPLLTAGRFEPLLDWLRTHIHQQGQRYTAAELVEQVTGAPLGHDALMRYLGNKIGTLYGLS